MNFVTTRLANGLTVVSAAMPAARGVALSVGFGAGSAHESDEEAGWAHLLEHLQLSVDAVTERSRERARGLKSLGAEFNAATGSETTDYTLHVARRFWPAAAEIFREAISQPMFEPSAIAVERAIVGEEAADRAADPFSLFAWNTLDHLFAGTPYAHGETRRSFGTPESLAAATPERLASWRERAYVASRAWVLAVGAIEHGELEEWASRLSVPVGAGLALRAGMGWKPVPDTHLVLPTHGQTHLALSWPTFGSADNRSAHVSMISGWLGSGAGSRLFEEMRGRRGLAYSLFTDHIQFSSAGAFQFVMQMSDKTKADEAIDVAREIITAGHRQMSRSDYDNLRRELTGKLEIAIDNPSTLLALASDHLASYGRVRQPNEIIERLESATIEEVRETWREFLTTERALLSRLN